MRRRLVPLAVAAAWCALILFVHRDSPRTLVSAHGLLHAAIAERFAPDVPRPPLATPPENPLFAGTPLPYYYFFHAVGAQLAALLHVDVIHAFEWMVLAAAAVAVLAGFALARRLHGGAAPCLAAGAAFALLFFAGCHPQGPLVLLARFLRDGSAPLADRGQYLWGLVHPINAALRIGDYYGTLGPLVAYFFNVTARPLALASLVVVIALLAAALDGKSSGRLRERLGLALAMALCTLFSPLVGLAATAAFSAALLVSAARDRRRGEPGLARGELCAAAALCVGAALAFPWYRHLFRDSGGAIAFGFNAKRALGAVASAWLVALLSACSVRTATTPGERAAPVLHLAGLLLALPIAFVALPVGNEDNLLHAAIVCWSAVAAGFVARRPARLAFLHLAFVPTLALLVLAYVGRPPIPISFDHESLQRTPADGDEARLYGWLRSRTPADAVIVQDPGSEGRQCTGNTSELPAMSGRVLFADYERHYLVSGHPDAARRVLLARRLARGEATSKEDDRYLSALRRPLLVVSFEADAATAERLAAAHGAPLFEAGSVRVFSWRSQE